MPSKSRGLRTSTGCLVCRKRRVKCDETQPRCKNCTRVERDCEYPQKSATPQRPRALSARTVEEAPVIPGNLPLPGPDATPLSLPVPPDGLSSSAPITTQSWIPFSIDPPQIPGTALPDDSFFLDDSLFSFGDTLTPSFGPIEWYDLLAQDAIDTMQDQNPSNRWNFDYSSLSRRQTPRQSVAPDTGLDDGDGPASVTQDLISEPWNTDTPIELKEDELIFFEHYINVVAPILDLFDPLNHFASMVPHLALRNVGLLKSILAVGARHLTLGQSHTDFSEATLHVPPDTPTSVHSLSPNAAKFAEQYYFETLQYLSQNLLYQTYTGSHEILVTAIMISTYEMFGTAENPDHSAWDRHLRGAFWIQRNSNTSGESNDSLKRAVWFSWLRQDIWAAFRTGRPALTIHQPTKSMSELTTEELTTRIIYITAKCVQFAATPKEQNITEYIEAGATLMRMLDAWKRRLPQAFEPIRITNTYSTPRSASDSVSLTPIWIHPPAHAAAIQMYHFSRIVMVLNQPSIGGLNVHQTRFKMLRESTTVICGIAAAQQSQNLPSAFVSFQAVYAAALCADSQEKQAEILEILDRVLHISKFPSRSILSDLVKVWSGGG
ncbi:fungal-specific transcription factor domain-containing protein [Boeremia exigua]|uniref:fungal-specific transcription factor domain-containing protein n=1 Tax=Boeremia exigua TaxID=749465 RepID=UPI001E8ED2F1|nr:fungal-specific transcription factor domain-containing protein [Boeremia exigua]KAH6625744.1 fungal-specific transcription factor domain-containing protein [Boeremia exigua]